jgi:transcriptional regulator with XRE-family HTH domain
MARAAVGLGIRDLAAIAVVSQDTVARFERGEVLRASTVARLRAALEFCGVIFLDDDPNLPGVRFDVQRIETLQADRLSFDPGPISATMDKDSSPSGRRILHLALLLRARRRELEGNTGKALRRAENERED